MSEARDLIERLCQRHGVPALDAMEFFLERAAIREFDGAMTRDAAEQAAVSDLEIWARLWVQMKGEVGPQLTLLEIAKHEAKS